MIILCPVFIHFVKRNDKDSCTLQVYMENTGFFHHFVSSSVGTLFSPKILEDYSGKSARYSFLVLKLSYKVNILKCCPIDLCCISVVSMIRHACACVYVIVCHSVCMVAGPNSGDD